MNNTCIKISDIVNDCTTYCVDTTVGEPLSSILQKLCTKIDDFEEEDPLFTQWLASTPLDQEGKVFSSDGNQFIWILPEELPGLVVNVSADENNCLETREDGLFIECSSASTLYTVSNGLTEDPETNFKLGGTLEEETLITQSTFGITLDYDGTNFALHANNSSNGGGLWGQTSDGYGVYGTATSGLGVVGVATTGIAGTFQNISDDFPALNVTNQGIGNVADFSNVDGLVASIFSTGQVRLHNYGDGTFADTATFLLGVDGNGNVIETDASALLPQRFAVSGEDDTAGETRLFDVNTQSFRLISSAASTPTSYVLSIESTGGRSALELSGIATSNSPLKVIRIGTNPSQSETQINIVKHLSSGTPAGGLGSNINFVAPDSASVDKSQGAMSFAWSSATAGSHTGRFAISLANLGATHPSALSIEGNGQTTVHRAGDATSILNGFNINRGTPSGSSNGFGSSIEFRGDTPGGVGSAVLYNGIISTATDVVNVSRTSELSFTGVSNAVTSTLFTLGGDGAARLNQYGIGTFTGTPAFLLSVDATGNIIETGTTGLYTFQNGLTETSGVVELGGDLLKDTTINSEGFSTIITGSVDGNSLYVINTDNTHTVSAIRGEALGAGGVGVHGEGGSVGVVGISTLGIGLTAIGAQGANINSTTATTTGNEIMAFFTRNSSGTTTNNVSGSINIGIEDDSGSAHLSNQIISKMTTVAALSRVSELSFTGVDNALTKVLLTISGAGIFTLVQSLQDFADDAAAAIGLIPVNALYRTGSAVKMRVS